jgi:polyphosphate kinase
MDRNFFRRVELCFPVLDKKLKQRVIKEGLKHYLKDDRQAWDMDAEGHYARKNPRGTLPRSAQMTLLGDLSHE